MSILEDLPKWANENQIDVVEWSAYHQGFEVKRVMNKFHTDSIWVSGNGKTLQNAYEDFLENWQFNSDYVNSTTKKPIRGKRIGL